MLMNIPYAAFYAAESDGVDAISTATLKFENTGLAGGSYHEVDANTDADSMAVGVTYPVFVSDLSVLDGALEVTDETVKTINLVTSREKTVTPTEVRGTDVLFCAPSYSWYRLTDAPSRYKTLAANGTTFTFGAVSGRATTAEVTTSVNYDTHHGNEVEIAVNGTGIEKTDTVNGVVVSFDDGTTLGLPHVQGIWARTQIGFHQLGELAGKTITNIRYITTNAVIDCPVSIKLIRAEPAPITYTVSFDANGHGTAPVAQVVEKGTTATEPVAPTENGWTFGGWYTEESCENKFDFQTAIIADITLFAKWTEDSGASPEPATYTVTFETNGGSAVASQTVRSGEKAAKPNDPTKLGFVFDGWYQDAAFAAAFDFEAAITADITAYAKWKEVSTPIAASYTVVRGGSSTWTKGSSATVTITVKRSEADDTCFRHFTGVQIGGTALVNGTDYTATAGSTVITIKPSILEKLSVGANTVTVNFDDGKVETVLNIQAASTTQLHSPKTGDDRAPELWVVLMLLSGLCLAVIGISGRRKGRFNS